MRFSDMTGRIARAIAFSFLVLLAACGGGGGGSGSGDAGSQPTTPVVTPPVVTPSLANFTSVVVDDGPAALGVTPNAYRAVNAGFVTVTICAPGTSTCQTIDHVSVDNGSVGLRIASAVLTPAFLAALPKETDTQGNPVGECYGFVDGYLFGSVRQADFTIGGEKVANMPVQVIGDGGTFASVPAECSAGGGTQITTVKELGSNGVLGIGVTPTDCGQSCASPGGTAAAIYYDCPSTGCAGIIGRASTTSAPFQQLPNPVAAMSVDNNGTVLTFPAVPAGGADSVTGTLYFGIGTQTNNGLAGTVALQTTGSFSPGGSGTLPVTYNGRSLPYSFIDSGSSGYFFADSAIASCTKSDEAGFYCPTSPLLLTPTLMGLNGTSVSGAFTLNNADSLISTGGAALPGLGADAAGIDGFSDISQSFDFGLPFFYGKSIYTAIEGRTAGGVAGPFFAIR